MAYEFFYEGTPYSLEPSYGDFFIGYRLPTRELSLTTDARTANQIKEVSDKINPGGKSIEISMVSPEIFEAVPEQHLKEINRLTKLTGVEPSVHGPLVEPSGVTKQGWSEESRKAAERQLQLAMERSHKIDPKGNIPVTIHSSAALPGATPAVIEEEGKRKKIEKQIIAINRETNQMIPIEREVKYYPETGKEIREARDEIKTINNQEWINSITNIAFYKKEADEILKKAHAVLAPVIAMKERGEKIDLEKLSPKQQQALQEMAKAELFLDNINATFRSLYNKAYKYTKDEKVKDILVKEIAEPWKKLVEEREKLVKEKGRKIDFLDKAEEIIKESFIMDRTLEKLREIPPPEVYKPLDEFALEHSAKTFANVAFNAYKKFGEKAPILSIENPPAGAGLSRAEDIKKLVEKSRKMFVNEAVKKGYSKNQAEKAAKKLIGATWDVGHINMLRKYGFEKKDILEETEKIAPFVKHVHLSDNFGFEHTELPMGMGNVPTKEIMEKLGKEGFKGKKVIEAISWWQHFKTPPLIPTLEAFGSPLYPMLAQPVWNQIAYTSGGYFSGYGPILPEQHFSMYGAGFSGLPSELGGQVSGGRSRFSGTPTE